MCNSFDPFSTVLAKRHLRRGGNSLKNHLSVKKVKKPTEEKNKMSSAGFDKSFNRGMGIPEDPVPAKPEDVLQENDDSESPGVCHDPWHDAQAKGYW